MSTLGTQKLCAVRGRASSGFEVPPLGGGVRDEFEGLEIFDARCNSDVLPPEGGTPNERQRARISGRLFFACSSAVRATLGTGPSFSGGNSSVRLSSSDMPSASTS